VSLDLQRFFKQKPVDSTKNLTLRQVLSVTKPRKFPTWKQWQQLSNVLSAVEKKLMGGALTTFVLSFGFLATFYVLTHQVEIPAVGGEYTEAVIGEPRLINPLYASVNDVDADLSKLIYSGLTKWDGQAVVADLAESIQPNDTFTRFTIKLKPNLKFSNGEPLLVKDVIFTVSAIKNPKYRSPLIATLKGSTIEQVDDNTLAFNLEKANPFFANSLTFGILPETLWSEILPQNTPLAAINLQPVGSGPYAFTSFTKDKKGSIRSFSLKPNTHYYAERAKIKQVTFKFYSDANAAAQALSNKNTEGLGFVSFENIAPLENNRSVRLIDSSVLKSTSLIFNQNNRVLKNAVVRQAISASIDKDTLIKNVLHGHGRVITSPILFGMTGYSEPTASSFDLKKAQTDLTTAGFVLEQGAQFRSVPKPPPAPKSKSKKKAGPEPEQTTQEYLSLRLVTTDTPELKAVAQLIQTQLKQVGIEVVPSFVALESFQKEVVEPRAFDLLLTSSLLTTNTDPILFWHSSQIGKGGLNVAGYQSKDADKWLEKAKDATNLEAKTSAYRQFQEIVVKDVPAVFLYQSSYVYAMAKKVQFAAPSVIRVPSDRFSNVETWYIKTKKVLK